MKSNSNSIIWIIPFLLLPITVFIILISVEIGVLLFMGLSLFGITIFIWDALNKKTPEERIYLMDSLGFRV